MNDQNPPIIAPNGNILDNRGSQVGWAQRAHPTISGFEFRFSSPERRRVAETGQGILTNMFEHVDAQRIVRVYEEA